MAEQTSDSRNVPSDSPLVAGWRFWLWWALASAVAWGVGGPMGMAVGSFGDIIVAGFMGAALGGIVAGMLQWLVLRRQLARAGWWVLASTMGWVVGGFLSGAVPVGGFLGWAALGAVYGSITGTVLVWLLRQPVPAASADE